MRPRIDLQLSDQESNSPQESACSSANECRSSGDGKIVAVIVVVAAAAAKFAVTVERPAMVIVVPVLGKDSPP